VIFVDGNTNGVSVDRSARRKHERFHARSDYFIKKCNGLRNIDPIVSIRRSHRFTDLNQSSEIHDGFGGDFFEDGSHCRAIADGTTNQRNVVRDSLGETRAEIVENHRGLAMLFEATHEMRSDVACSTRNQNCHGEVLYQRAERQTKVCRPWVNPHASNWLTLGASHDRANTLLQAFAKFSRRKDPLNHVLRTRAISSSWTWAR